MIRIEVVTTYRTGFIVAVDTATRPGAALIVGQVHRDSIDGEDEQWKAWLWRQPGRYPQGHSDAVTVKGAPRDLAVKLRRQHQAKGAWWQ